MSAEERALVTTRALDLSHMGADMSAVLREAEAQAGVGNSDQLGMNEYNDRRWVEGFRLDEDDELTRENLGWED